MDTNTKTGTSLTANVFKDMGQNILLSSDDVLVYGNQGFEDNSLTDR